MMPIAIAGVQMHVSTDKENLSAMRARLAELMHRFPWVQMVVFSELCAFGPNPVHAHPLPGPTEQIFQEMASKHGVWLLPGSIFERRGEQLFNTAIVIDPAGKVVGRYRKMFPFRPYEADVEAGTEFLTFDVPQVGRFGVSICYDMWFPETTRTLAAMGAEVILHPTMTNTLDRDVELAIARASAAINQCYFVDINGVGGGGYGRSILVGPNGSVLYTAGSGEELLPFEADLERVRRARKVGLHGLGQPLKSFRDRMVDFSVYRHGAPGFESLAKLGELAVPQKPTGSGRISESHGGDR
ncbi:MAG: carbon-nitrogen hydrolase family protein [Planctomycetota bacterium]